jgi:glucose/arabinose dehydrogenase
MVLLMRTILSLLSAMILLSSCQKTRGKSPTDNAPPTPETFTNVELKVVAEGLNKPLALLAAPGDAASKRLFIVEQEGFVVIFRNGKVEPVPFIDVSKKISRNHSEQGLLGLDFHPDFVTNGKFYLNYTDRKGDTRVVEHKVSAANPDQADAGYERQLLLLDQPYANHNGGHIAFGPDKKLYVGTGDGGSANDPKDNGQNPTALLGKMLRLDVDAETPAPEIIMSGLRNPWRYSFDRKTGDLYIADVGQNMYEEIDIVAAKDINSKPNFGWNIVEGNGHCLMRPSCDQKDFVLPAFEYSHQVGCSITGGFVYRGKALPELDGVYFYADYCTGVLRSFKWKDGAVSDHWDWKPLVDTDDQLASLASFGEDEAGELYLLSHDGVVYQFTRK